MSVTVMGRVFWTDIAELDAIHKNGKGYKVSASTAKLVLLAMADSSDDWGENSYNSIDTLAIKTSLKRRSVPRVVRALEQHAYCKYVGISVYGTSNYSVNLEKLANVPEKRSKIGRPKTSDSSNNIAKTSDSSNQKRYQSHLIRINKDKKYAALVSMYENAISLVADIYTSQMLQDAVDDYPLEWFDAAFKIAVENNSRKWNYVAKILRSWKEHYFGWKPGDRDGKPQVKQAEKKAPPPPEDDGRDMTTPDMLQKARTDVVVSV